MRYYLAIDGQSQGPFPEEEIITMVRDGRVTPDMQAVPEGSDQWQPLSSFIAIPPAVPPAVAGSPAVAFAGYVPPSHQKPRSNVGLIVGIIVGGLVVIVGVIAILAALAVPQISKATQRARMARDISNLKQVKLTLDSFAMDNDGLYPAEKTHRLHTEGLPGPTSSNDYFRQLFASGYLRSRGIFWVENADVCNEDPPEELPASIITSDPALVLKKGECGLSYVVQQASTDNPARPLIMTAFMAGTDQFDPDLYDGKANVLRIDGSVKPLRLNGKGRVLDHNGDDLLRPESDVWGPATTPSIAQPIQ